MFNLIILIVIFALANSFYFIGQNQIEFDDIDPSDYPDYAQGLGLALQHVFKMIVLEFELDYYVAGRSPS